MYSARPGHYLYTVSLFLLILLMGACIAISATDVIIKARSLRTPSGEFDFRSLAVVAAGYFLLALLALSFSCSRVLTVRAALQGIPKSYMPIKENDIPKKVFACVQRDFEQVKKTRQGAGPKADDVRHPGWAIPGSSNLEGVNFKRAIAQTPFIIEQAAIEVNADYARPPYITVRKYIEFLIRQGLIDAHLGQGYRVAYESSRFSKAPISEDRYLDNMKYLAAILHNMGYRLLDSNMSHSTHASTRRWHPRDDDVASLAQSVATWTSRSTSVSRNFRNTHRSISRIDDSDMDDRQMYLAMYGRVAVDGVRTPF